MRVLAILAMSKKGEIILNAASFNFPIELSRQYAMKTHKRITDLFSNTFQFPKIALYDF